MVSEQVEYQAFASQASQQNNQHQHHSLKKLGPLLPDFVASGTLVVRVLPKLSEAKRG